MSDIGEGGTRVYETPVAFLDAGVGRCRFIVSDRPVMVCGAPVVDPNGRVGLASWCPHHYEIVYPSQDERQAVREAMKAADGRRFTPRRILAPYP